MIKNHTRFVGVVVVCHNQLRYQVILSRIDSGVNPVGCALQAKSVSRLVAKLHGQYRCCLVRLTPGACSLAVDGSVLIVVVRECIVISFSVSAPRPLLGVSGLSVLCCFLGAVGPNPPRVCACSGGFFLSCAESMKNS